MSTQHSEGLDVPTDTFELRLAIARFHAGNISAREAAMLEMRRRMENL